MIREVTQGRSHESEFRRQKTGGQGREERKARKAEEKSHETGSQKHYRQGNAWVGSSDNKKEISYTVNPFA